MSKTLNIIAIIIGILSIVSLSSRAFELGLNTIFSDLINYYREASSRFWEIITFPIPLKIHSNIIDLWNLSFLGAGAYVKTEGIENSRALSNIDTKKLPKWWKIIYFFILGFSFIGVAFTLSIISVDTYLFKDRDIMRRSNRNILVIISGVILYFIMNAYAPSVG